jgi:probable F420-dependent oxidoreductase
MQIGFNLPVSGPMAAPETMAEMASLGEALGFDYLTLTDHIALPDTSVPGYPYSESGSFYSPEPGHRHEQLIAATFVAARTRKIRLVLAVMVVPHRPAVLAAKQLTTLDVLSSGRLTLGVGAGWLKAEFDAVVTTPFAERGAVTDEYLDAIRTLWTEAKPSIHGKYVQFDGLVFDPNPVQRPHPPIWVGGESGPSMRRAARLGDAWYPIGSNNAHLLDTLPRLEAGIARLRKLTAEAGRDPAQIGVVYRVKRHGHAAPPATDGHRRLFSNGLDNVIADVHALKRLGVTGIDFDFEGRDAAKAKAEMQQFCAEVLPSLRSA